ncbi:glycosyltransferase family 2 protein [Candidatus Woesearchaeota archaeon]|jgi:glycosyltransferase involved in cell wall biosynthesis|nr:glycosyltransferase family 2 protein [Candidatus Ruthturnera sp.]MBT4207342.1 glycosyltransferase family 2 protein [Candidatus Woesearchaeota archaeon]
MDCSLIITTYNWPEALELVLITAARQSTQPDEIIIADDGSNKDTKLLINEFSNKTSIPIVHSWQEDNGFRLSKSRNLAIAKAKYEYIIVIDGDMLLHKDFIRDHKKCAKKNTYIQGSRALLQPEFSRGMLKTKDIKRPSIFSNDVKNKLNTLRLPFLSAMICRKNNQNMGRIRGCNFSLFKEDIIKVNGFNEEFTTWGREDSEFVQRLFNAGIYRSNLKFSALQYHLFHKEGSANDNNISILNNTINNSLVWCKYGIDQYLEY